MLARMPEVARERFFRFATVRHGTKRYADRGALNLLGFGQVLRLIGRRFQHNIALLESGVTGTVVTEFGTPPSLTGGLSTSSPEARQRVTLV